MLEIDITKPIAAGRTAEIFALDKQYVLKLFLPYFPADEAENEAALVQAVCQAGVKTPAVVEVVAVNGRCGFVMERIEGRSMLAHMQADLNQINEFAQALAQLHAELHQHSSMTLVAEHEWLARKIKRAEPLRDEMKTAVLAHLQRLPHEDIICHGDFHMDNIIITADGPVIIDWCNANRGHPLSDVARTSLMLTKGALPPDMSPAQQVAIQELRAAFNQVYLDHYFALQPYAPAELLPWHLPVTAARLSETIPEETAVLVADVQKMVNGE